jgi:hypothetical protein
MFKSIPGVGKITSVSPTTRFKTNIRTLNFVISGASYRLNELLVIPIAPNQADL